MQRLLLLGVGYAAAQSTIPGVVYSPQHSSSYPLLLTDRVNTKKLATDINNDLKTIAPYYQLVRTMASSYRGVAITPIAAKHNLLLYLGIPNTDDYQTQVDAAMDAVRDYPSTIAAIILGSDDVGDITTPELIDRVHDLRLRIKQETTSDIKIGTAQRLQDWLNPELVANMTALGNAVDIVGVNYFPYLEPTFDIANPLDLIDVHWPLLQSRYPSTKLAIMETGFPTKLGPEYAVPVNASFANAKQYYNAFKLSSYSPLGFYYTFFDSQAKDPNGDIGAFGLFTANGKTKGILPDWEAFQNESGAFSTTIPGACYSPFHLDSYPMNGIAHGSLRAGMDADFKIMKQYVGVVRTYYSNYMGIDVTPIAAANNVPLFLGVFMTNENWYNTQFNSAIDAAVNYPTTVKAILIGNENVMPYGPYSASYINNQISSMRSSIAKKSNGKVSVAIGTVQRISEWLNPAIRSDMLALAANSDIIGVNIYPFFDNSYQSSNPLVLLNALWNQMLAIYPASKLRLTETGFSTGGSPPPMAPRVIPSLTNSMQYYSALMNWQPQQGGGELFWYTFFDLRADDRTQPLELETYFGFFTAKGSPKAANYPYQYNPLEFGFIPANSAPTPAPVIVTPTFAVPTPAPAPALVPLAPLPASVRNLRGANYDPFHNAAYINQDKANIPTAIGLDLLVYKNYFSVVRTVYSNFYGIDIIPFFAAAQLDVYLGVFMTRQTWYQSQVQSAITGVKTYGSHIKAVLVGNENAYMSNEPYTAAEILAHVLDVKSQILKSTGKSVVIGTVQTAATWLSSTRAAEMQQLASGCDVIGVSYRPFLDGPYDPNNPMAGLDAIWSNLRSKYPPQKLRLVDVGFPSSPVKSDYNSVATPAMEQAFYAALVKWNAVNSAVTESFWTSFFDNAALYRTAGFFTDQRQPKIANFPPRLDN